jgi:hypothetical protein
MLQIETTETYTITFESYSTLVFPFFFPGKTLIPCSTADYPGIASVFAIWHSSCNSPNRIQALHLGIEIPILSCRNGGNKGGFL